MRYNKNEGLSQMDKESKIKELLSRGVEQIIVKESLAKKLKSDKRLRVKLGVDPTSPKIHLGHSVILRKLRDFQDLGHQAIFLVGDFTAQIGDPSDKLSARKSLSRKEIQGNMKKYKEQVGKILDLSRVEIRYNSEWHSKMDFAELFEVMSRFTVNQMLERDMFQERMKKKKPLWIHELMYPILQGYDSVALRADVELGGTDQTFNMLAARTVQPYYQQRPQDIMTTSLIEGTDGQKKMSKSVGNTIDLDDSPQEMFGKVMSLPDHLIIKYFTLLTNASLNEINEFTRDLKSGKNPKGYKVKLALELVSMYHNKEKALGAETEFNRVFKEKKPPIKIPKHHLKKESYKVIDLMVETGLAPSKSEARRLVEQGGVQLNRVPVKDWDGVVVIKEGVILKVGKRRFVKLVK